MKGMIEPVKVCGQRILFFKEDNAAELRIRNIPFPASEWRYLCGIDKPHYPVPAIIYQWELCSDWTNGGYRWVLFHYGPYPN